jgi:FSR family fosmidomycin resistance protein-like MFS transporter
MMKYKALILLIAGHFVTDINTGALPGFLPFIKESLSLSYTMTASIILVFNVTSSVIQPIFGYSSDRWPARWLLPAGCFIAPLGLGLLGFGSSYAWILFFVSLSGLGQASYHPEGFKIVNQLSGKKKASFNSLFLFGGNLGFAVGPILATLFYSHFGLKGSLWFILPGIAMAAVLLAIPDWRGKEDFSMGQAGYPEETGPSRRRLFPLALVLIVAVFRSGARLCLLTFIPFYFIKILHADPVTAGKYLSIFLVAGTVGGLAGGLIADRYGYRRFVLTSLGLSSIFLYLFFFTPGSWSLIFFAVAGMTLVSSHAVTMAIGQSFMPRNVGMASGLILGLSNGIGGITATLLGWVADHWGIPFTLQIIFMFPLFAFLTFLFIPYPPSPQADSWTPSLESTTMSSARQLDSSAKGGR